MVYLQIETCSIHVVGNLFKINLCCVRLHKCGLFAAQVQEDLKSVCPCIVDDRKRDNQLDSTQWFIELMIRSTCFGHYYAHHQELETIQMFTA